MVRSSLKTIQLAIFVYFCLHGSVVADELGDFEQFKRDNAPLSTAPMPPAESVLKTYRSLPLVQKFFFLENYFLEQSVSGKNPTMLVNATESQIRKFLMLYPVEVVDRVPQRNLYSVRIPTQFSQDEFLELCRQKLPEIYFEIDGRFDLNQPPAGEGEIGEHLKSLQWSVATTYISTKTFVPFRRIKVGILDSGIATHYDLPSSTIGKEDFNGHGTHVTGIIAALQNNYRGIDGMTALADLKVYKVLSQDGNGSAIELIAALEQARKEGCEVINLSVGTHHYSKMLFETLTDLARDKIIMIAAAGNESTDKPTYPASHPFVIGVGSYQTKQKISDFSNFGSSNLEVSFPGENVISTHLDDQLKSMSGTSMAAPMMSALMVEILARLKTQPDPAVIMEIMRRHRNASNAKYKVEHAPFDIDILMKILDETIFYVEKAILKKQN